MKLFDVNMIRTAGDGAETQEAATIGLEFVRTFYPRHDGPGTRLTFNNGKGFAVSNTFEEIKAAMASAGIRVVDVDMVDENARPASNATNGIDDNDADGEPVEAGPVPDPSSPAVVNPAYLRAFYARHAGHGAGTRLTFADGGGFAITNLYPEFKASLTVN